MIDTSYGCRGPSGTAVYLEQLVRALRERGEVEVVQVAQRRRLPAGEGNAMRSAVNALLDLAWLHVGLPRAALLCGADVMHHPLPAYSRRIGCPQVATLHDVAFEIVPEGYGRIWRGLARRAYRRAARRSAALVCVSESTAADAVEILGAAPSRIVVAPHGPGQIDEAMPPAEGERSHFLYVGDTQRRKRVDALLAAYAAYRARAERPLDLVLAGEAAGAAGAAGVRGVRTPAREELLRLYGSAVALIHPAIHEGFGLPVLEAMAAGTPVIAQRTPATAEVGGEAALLVEEGGLAEAMARVASDADLRAELALRGRTRAARFSWSASAQAHERAYTLACR